jgi:hypothetical protein
MENVSRTRSGSAYAYGLSTTAWTTLKIAVVAPMPSPSVRTAAAVKPGLVRHCRQAPFVQAPLSRGASFGRIDPAIDQLLRAQLEMVGELLVDFLLDRHAPEERSQPLTDSHRTLP